MCYIVANGDKLNELENEVTIFKKLYCSCLSFIVDFHSFSVPLFDCYVASLIWSKGDNKGDNKPLQLIRVIISH